jgi:formate hydrogenlyase subunit 4
MSWIRDRALTLVLMTMFLVFLVGQLLTGQAEYNGARLEHRESPLTMAEYVATGHPWEVL